MKVHQYLQDMATFVEVARLKSFSGAADLLDLPTSSVSRQISKMEARLGVKLFHRTSRKVHLTAAGESYYAQCRGVIDAAKEVEPKVRSELENMAGVDSSDCFSDSRTPVFIEVLSGLFNQVPRSPNRVGGLTASC